MNNPTYFCFITGYKDKLRILSAGKCPGQASKFIVKIFQEEIPTWFRSLNISTRNKLS